MGRKAAGSVRAADGREQGHTEEAGPASGLRIKKERFLRTVLSCVFHNA
jgi:hypothetical protein